MDIRYTLLGFLDWKSFSGYDLKKMISHSDLFYWSGNNNQIYTALIQLNKQGLVTQKVEYQESLPAKKIYSITEEGRIEFRQWLSSAPELPQIQNNFLIQLAWANLLSDSEIDDLLSRYHEEIAIQVKMCEETAARKLDRLERNARERFLRRRIDDNLTDVYRNELKWIEKVREDLKDRNFDSSNQEKEE